MSVMAGGRGAVLQHSASAHGMLWFPTGISEECWSQGCGAQRVIASQNKSSARRWLFGRCPSLFVPSQLLSVLPWDRRIPMNTYEFLVFQLAVENCSYS